MADRFYLSNVRPHWPIDRQEAVLDEFAPGWRRSAVYYRDVLSSKHRQAPGVTALTERTNMLRPTARRRSDETIIVASLAALARTLPDLLSVLAQLAGRGATLRALAEDVTVPPGAGAESINAAGDAFVAAARRGSGEGPSKGGRISGERREARAKAACEHIRERWALPSDQHPTVALLAEADVSRATAKKHLGHRNMAQERYRRAYAQAERNRKRKALSGDS